MKFCWYWQKFLALNKTIFINELTKKIFHTETERLYNSHSFNKPQISFMGNDYNIDLPWNENNYYDGSTAYYSKYKISVLNEDQIKDYQVKIQDLSNTLINLLNKVKKERFLDKLV